MEKQHNAQIDKSRSALRQQLRRRTQSLFRKALELNILCGANTYIIVECYGRFEIFNSERTSSWVPSEDKLVEAPNRLLLRYTN